jgi:malonyl-CoA decarboxylase
LRRITWDSPASLIERLIQYEAVHDIKSWADVKNRLDSDRRCYGFFSPRMPDIPLIFVQVALLHEIPTSVVPLLDESAAAADLKAASVAVFYSISNTQVGLRGVPFGDSLIKRVVEALCEEFPKLRTFVTLSPIPGYRGWLQKKVSSLMAVVDRRIVKQIDALPFDQPGPEHKLIAASEDSALLAEHAVLRSLHLSFAAHYLRQITDAGEPLDPVARFHLGNGARVQRLNWAADPSSKGVKQSYGMMVNYLYDLKRLDRNRQLLSQGKVASSTEIDRLIV